jgi:hypothetical protein
MKTSGKCWLQIIQDIYTYFSGSPEYLFKTILDYFLDEITFEGQTPFPDFGRSDTEQIVFTTTLKAFRHELSKIIK